MSSSATEDPGQENAGGQTPPPYRIDRATLEASAAISGLIATAGDRWVCWGYLFREKWTKPPLRPTTISEDTRRASVTDPTTWSSYAACIEAATAGGAIVGVGLVITADDDLIGIDIDRCLDDQIAITDPAIADLVERLGSYCEVSPSGYGLRVLVRGEVVGLPGGKSGFHIKVGETKVEVYGGGRYVTLTGDRFGETPDSIEPAQGMLDWLLEQHARQESDHKSGANGANGAAGPDFDFTSAPPNEEALRQRLKAFLLHHAEANTLWRQVDLPKGDGSRSGVMLRLAGLFARQLGWGQGEIVWALSAWCRERGHPDKLGRECERTARKALEDLAAERQQQNGATDPDFDGPVPPETWLEPVDVLGAPELTGWPSLTAECLPEPLYDFVMAESERMNVDPCALAAHVISACTVSISDAWRAKPKKNDSYTQQARIWACVVKDVGARGSDMIKSAFKPITERQKNLHATWCRAHADWKIRQAARKKADPADPEPKPSRLVTSDTTIEKASDILSEGNEYAKLVLMCDELAVFLEGFERYSQGGSGRGQWLESYDGDAKWIDRIKRGSIFVKNWSVVIAGNIQPRRLIGIGSDVIKDGLLQRFVAIHARPAGVRDNFDPLPPSPNIAHNYQDLHDTLARMRPVPGIGGKPTAVWFDDDARAVYEQFDKLINRLKLDKTLPYVISEFGSKWSGLVVRLALTFHLAALADRIRRGDKLKRGEIHLIAGATVNMAATFLRRIVLPNLFRLGFESLPDKESATHVRWIAGHILARNVEKITARDIGRAYRELRGDHRMIAQAIEFLCDCGWARPTIWDKRHNPYQWDINPEVHTRFATAAAAEKERRDAVIALLRSKVSDL